MKRTFVKKTMAVAMATTMILGSTMTVFATEQQTTDTIPGTGEVEGVVDTSVFDVVVPTVDEGTYDFRLDPQGLIEATGTASTADGRISTHVTHTGHENAEFTIDTTMYFANSVTEDSTPITLYTNTSAKASFENHSTTKVDVTVIAEVKDAAGIAISEDKTFSGDTTASMYLELNDTGSKVAVVDSETKIATLTTTLDALADTNFKPKYDDETGEYSYELIDSPTIESGSKFSYVLTGAANENGAWTEEQKEAAPAIEVTWKIEVYQGQAPAFATGDALGQIKITSEGDGNNALASITNIMMTNDLGTFNGYAADPTGLWLAATTADNVITFDEKFVEFFNTNEETEAIITYVTVGGVTKVATVDVITKVVTE